ncbi:hypothetical protein Acr_00g0065960 [Actinidia rufa]|uniref:Uncharacterized protein n=1 Tax=Actinidia rufa TaxID=165716 RepID=A0A7J0DQ62_9ERIC|nr:hypothetical protein Acr_00g0065960 [Actinidia rufa]
MSHRINLGEGKFGQSLPSWISYHLGGKSYITDEATQSPLPSRGSLTDHLSTYPEMDTSSLTKETNVMSQTDLNKLREKYSFPSGVQLRIPREGKTILSARQVIWRYYKCHMSYYEFRCLYSLSPLPDSGWYYFKASPDKNLLRGSPEQCKRVEEEVLFCFLREMGILPEQASGRGDPTGSEVLGDTSYNALPILTETEAKRTTEVLGKIEPGGTTPLRATRVSPRATSFVFGELGGVQGWIIRVYGDWSNLFEGFGVLSFPGVCQGSVSLDLFGPFDKLLMFDLCEYLGDRGIERGGKINSGRQGGTTWIPTRTSSFHIRVGQGLVSDVALFILDRCCGSGNDLPNDESDEIARHQECEERLEVVD